MTEYVQAHPTHRRNTISTLFPPPTTSFRSRSAGAMSPILGNSATGMGAGAGVSHGCTVSGRFLTCIHCGHLLVSSSSSSRPGTAPGGRSPRFFFSFFGGGSESPEAKLNVSLGIPSFFIASLVVRLENIVAVECVMCRFCKLLYSIALGKRIRVSSRV